jgi:hypothetical protein
MMRAVRSPLLGFVLVVGSLALTLVGPRALQAQTDPTAAQSAPVAPAASVDYAADSGGGIDPDLTKVRSESALPYESTEPDWDLKHRRFASWAGPTGGILLFDGRASEAGAVRVQFGLDAFSGSDYLVDGDKIDLTDQQLAINVSALKDLEFYGTLSNRSINQSKPTSTTLDVIGDFTVGGRFGAPLGKLIDIGGDLRGAFTNKVGGGGFDFGATSLSLRAALSIDLQRMAQPIPLLVRFNLGYLLDNTGVVVEDTEKRRYNALSDALPRADETRHLVSRLQRFAMNINRVDRLSVGAGVELPLRVADHFFLHPIVETQVGIPINRQNFDCANLVNVPNIGTTQSSEDGCYERITSALPFNLDFGMRVVPPVRGLSALVAVDIGLMGADRFVRELAPNLPWRLLFAVSYDYDARPVERLPVVEAAPMLAAGPTAVIAGRVRGTVTTSDGRSVPEVQVRYVDLKLSTMLTNEVGEFISEPLPPGSVAFEINHPDYDPQRCNATIPATGGDVPLACVIAAKPVVGRLQGSVTDSTGTDLLSPARIVLSGPTTALAMTDIKGVFALENLPGGNYQVRVEAGGYFIRQGNVSIRGRESTPFSMALTRKPLTPTITFSGDAIEAPAITYATETSTQLTAAGQLAVAEIADLLLSRPDLYVQVQGFGPSEDIAMARANAVKQQLLSAGVTDTHVETVGGGRIKFRFLLHR